MTNHDILQMAVLAMFNINTVNEKKYRAQLTLCVTEISPAPK